MKDVFSKFRPSDRYGKKGDEVIVVDHNEDVSVVQLGEERFPVRNELLEFIPEKQ
jgi:hypothetical protein